MLGAIIGDIAGSKYEYHNIKTKEFKLMDEDCFLTDDSIMTLAIGKALVLAEGNITDRFDNIPDIAVMCMQDIGREFPEAGYGSAFWEWLYSGEPVPYGSFGNGAAMRISAVPYTAYSIDEVKRLSEAVTKVTHDHPKGLKGAEAVAVAEFMALKGADKDDIRDMITKDYYDIDFTTDEIRDEYEYDVTCQGTVPQALCAFFESEDFEDAIRTAVSLGGDSDTLAAITGAVAGAYYGVPAKLRAQALGFVKKSSVLWSIFTAFEEKFGSVSETTAKKI